MNQTVIDYLIYYLDEAPPGRGAVLLTGQWGAGKTYFISAYISQREAARKKADPLNGPGHLLASLNGVRTTEEISAQFFAQTNPVLNSGVARLLGTAASRVGNTLTKGQMFKTGDEKAMLRFLARDIKGLTLVFDDLERCAMPIMEVMGFINTFVEREGAKVILLASEADIPEGQQEDYRRRKEKLVAKTLEVRTHPAAVYRIWAGEMRNAAAREAVITNEASALRTFEASKIGNLRSLRAVIEDFDRLVAGVDVRLSASAPALARLLRYMLAVWLELRGGTIQPQTLHKLGAVRLRRLVAGASGQGLTPEEESFARTADKYADVDWSDSVVPLESLAKLHDSGIIDRDVIDARLLEHPLIVEPEDAPSWRRLWRWFQLSPEDYQAVRASFLKDLDNYAITHPGSILHAVGLTALLLGHGDDLLDSRPITASFIEYIDGLERRDALIPAVEVLDGLDETGFGGLGYVETKSPHFVAVRDYLDAAVRRSLEKQLRAAAPSLLQTLRAGESRYDSLFEYGRSDGRYGGAPILQHIPPVDFADLCLSKGRLNDNLLGALNARYARDGDGEVNAREQTWINSLGAELRARAAALPPPHQSRMLKSVDYWWSELSATMRNGLARRRTSSVASGTDDGLPSPPDGSLLGEENLEPSS